MLTEIKDNKIDEFSFLKGSEKKINQDFNSSKKEKYEDIIDRLEKEKQ